MSAEPAGDGHRPVSLQLLRALRLSTPCRVALTGAGGKTTALFQLARQWHLALSAPVLVASSTHLGVWQAPLADQHWVITNPAEIESLAGQVAGVALFSGPAGADQRLSGLDSAGLEALAELAARLQAPLLVEADGARQRPLKAPANHEPVIPEWIDQVVVTAGLSGIGQPLAASAVHRPERFAELSGLSEGAVIGGQDLCKVLVHPLGGQKGIPQRARRVVLLNQADNPERVRAGLQMALDLLAHFDAVIVAALAQNVVHAAIEPVAGVILAGGSSSRYGQPKALLAWRGKPLIRYAVEAALAGGLSPVVVVLGAVVEPIRQALVGLPVTFEQNSNWQDGQSTSVRSGLRAALRHAEPRQLGGAAFLQADQPFVDATLVDALIQEHQRTLHPVIAPQVAGQRTTPVLFDQVTFGDFQRLQGDAGGRALFAQYPPHLVPWDDWRVLLDIDTPEDFRRLQEMG